jgi:hypothetical protein
MNWRYRASNGGCHGREGGIVTTEVESMFRYRIKDFMIANVVLALTLAAAIALGSFAALGVIAFVVGTFIVLPVVLVEIYVYRRKQGLWYRWRHPLAPRPRYEAPTDPLPYPRVLPFGEEGESLLARPRTHLFDSGDRSDPVSRVSILLKVAGQLERSGRIGAAARVYQQVIDAGADAPEALNAAARLRSLTARNAAVGLSRAE